MCSIARVTSSGFPCLPLHGMAPFSPPNHQGSLIFASFYASFTLTQRLSLVPPPEIPLKPPPPSLVTPRRGPPPNQFASASFCPPSFLRETTFLMAPFYPRFLVKNSPRAPPQDVCCGYLGFLQGHPIASQRFPLALGFPGHPSPCLPVAVPATPPSVFPPPAIQFFPFSMALPNPVEPGSPTISAALSCTPTYLVWPGVFPRRPLFWCPPFRVGRADVVREENGQTHQTHPSSVFAQAHVFCQHRTAACVQRLPSVGSSLVKASFHRLFSFQFPFAPLRLLFLQFGFHVL